MNSCTPGIVRNCWATAIPRIRRAMMSGMAHKTLIHRLPSRMHGTTPSCGGSQLLRRRRSSAALKLVSSCGCGAWRGSFARASAVIRASSTRASSTRASLIDKRCILRLIEALMFARALGFRRRRCGLSLRLSSQKKGSQHDSVVMKLVVSRVHERDRASSCQGT